MGAKLQPLVGDPLFLEKRGEVNLFPSERTRMSHALLLGPEAGTTTSSWTNPVSVIRSLRGLPPLRLRSTYDGPLPGPPPFPRVRERLRRRREDLGGRKAGSACASPPSRSSLPSLHGKWYTVQRSEWVESLKFRGHAALLPHNFPVSFVTGRRREPVLWWTLRLPKTIHWG